MKKKKTSKKIKTVKKVQKKATKKAAKKKSSKKKLPAKKVKKTTKKKVTKAKVAARIKPLPPTLDVKLEVCQWSGEWHTKTNGNVNGPYFKNANQAFEYIQSYKITIDRNTPRRYRKLTAADLTLRYSANYKRIGSDQMTTPEQWVDETVENRQPYGDFALVSISVILQGAQASHYEIAYDGFVGHENNTNDPNNSCWITAIGTGCPLFRNGENCIDPRARTRDSNFGMFGLRVLKIKKVN